MPGIPTLIGTAAYKLTNFKTNAKRKGKRMNEQLLKINTKREETTVSGRELHEALGIENRLLKTGFPRCANTALLKEEFATAQNY